MEQKVIYKLFLLIGSFLTLSNSGCNKSEVDHIVNTEYYYVNNSQYNIGMDIFNSNRELIREYYIRSLDTLMFSIKVEGGAGPFQFNDIKGFGDSISLNFSDLRYASLRKNYDSIFFEKTYVKIKINDKEYKMYFFFTNDDYENASELHKYEKR